MLAGGPFRYQVHAAAYLKAAMEHATVPVKQAVIAPSALSLLYPAAGLEGYAREAFLADLVDEAEADIRGALDAGAHVVQLDFTEGRLSLKLDPGGGVLDDFIALNNQVLERFSEAERSRIGVHTCPGGDRDSTHSADVSYAALLPKLFQLTAGNFYVQLASEADPEKVLGVIAEYLPASARIFIGVTDPIDPRVETPGQVRDRILAAARQLPADRLGTCDDCGFSPFADDTSTSRDTAFAKIRRVSRERPSQPRHWDCERTAMPHIDLNSDEPGILGLFRFRPETALPLSELADVLLRGPSSLTRGERELIAAYVSSLNACHFCASSHGAFAAAQLPEGMALVSQVRTDIETAPVSAKVKALLGIAAAVQEGGLKVTDEQVEAARAAGATDIEIHDSVLIAAAFCMFNRYVDGLGTFAPEDPSLYAAIAPMIVEGGYVASLGRPEQGS